MIKKSLLKNKEEDIRLLTVSFIAVLIISQLILINARVPTSSMESTIMVNDRLFASRMAFLLESPKRGDIIVFKFPDNKNILLVKRVIGMPGETVFISNGVVYIDGEPLKEELSMVIKGIYGPYLVPQKAYFMMGDNRNNSYDSRYWENKFVYQKDILAKAMLVYYPYVKVLK